MKKNTQMKERKRSTDQIIIVPQILMEQQHHQIPDPPQIPNPSHNQQANLNIELSISKLVKGMIEELEDNYENKSNDSGK